MNFVTITNPEYHAHEAIGHSSIVKTMRSPAHLREALDNPKEATLAMEFGTAIHTAVLEPRIFREEYAVVDEALLAGTLSSLDDYKTAATALCVKFDALNKDELKVAIKAADKDFRYSFKDDVQSEIAALTTERLASALASLDELKQAAGALGIEVGKMKKDDLKLAIKTADIDRVYSFRDEVLAEMSELTTSMMAGTLATLDDYRLAAGELGVKFDALSKDELKTAIKAADKDSRFKLYEEEFDRLYSGKILLKSEQFEAILKMRASLQNHKGANEMLFLSEGLAEKSAFWTDSETGILCKCRPDWLKLRFGRASGIADVKSCCNASADAFSKSIAQFSYDIQAAFYQDGVYAATGERVPFYFIAVEKDAPHAVAVYRASDEMIVTGREKYRTGLHLIKWCRDNNLWPAYQPNGEIETIDLPRWAANYESEL